MPERRAASSSWYLAIYLEPTVRIRSEDESYDAWDDAVSAAYDLASRFAGGALDYRSAYQQPREAYLAKLDELTGATDRPSTGSGTGADSGPT